MAVARVLLTHKPAGNICAILVIITYIELRLKGNPNKKLTIKTCIIKNIYLLLTLVT